MRGEASTPGVRREASTLGVRPDDCADSTAPGNVEAKTRICENCEREVPAESLHCAHCCGEDGLRGAVKRGAFTGGILGLIAGGMGAAFFLSIFGPEYNTWEVVSGIVFGFVLVGAVLGIKNSHNE